jgi:hypothetical protein
LRPDFLPHTWNNGMLDTKCAFQAVRRNLGAHSGIVFFERKCLIYYLLASSSTGVLPITHYAIFPEPIIPYFQHSNWGEAPKFSDQNSADPVLNSRTNCRPVFRSKITVSLVPRIQSGRKGVRQDERDQKNRYCVCLYERIVPKSEHSQFSLNSCIVSPPQQGP